MPDTPTPYYATPKQPRLIWNDRDKRRAAEPVPTQTVEVIRPFYADKAQGALDMAHAAAPENRLIWTNDNLVALTSLLHGDGTHEPLEGKVDLVYIDPPFAVQADFKINVEIEAGWRSRSVLSPFCVTRSFAPCWAVRCPGWESAYHCCFFTKSQNHD